MFEYHDPATTCQCGGHRSEWSDPILVVPDVTTWRLRVADDPGAGREIEVQLLPGCDAIVRDDGGPTGIFIDMSIGDGEGEGAILFLPEDDARQLAADLLRAADELAGTLINPCARPARRGANGRAAHPHQGTPK